MLWGNRQRNEKELLEEYLHDMGYGSHPIFTHLRPCGSGKARTIIQNIPHASRLA